MVSTPLVFVRFAPTVSIEAVEVCQARRNLKSADARRKKGRC
jgi:hypothetical protein